MSPLEVFRLAYAEIGDVSAAELSAHIEKKHGLKIAPPFIPIYRATVQQLEKSTRFRQDAKPK